MRRIHIQKINSIIRRYVLTNKWLVAGLIGLLVIGTGLFLVLTRPAKTEATFEEKLNTLIKSVESLGSSLEVPEMSNIGTNLESYQAQLDDLDKQCLDLIKIKRPNGSRERDVAGERVNGICEDLIRVAIYSQKLHEHIQDYILLPDTEWPKPGTEEFNARLNTIDTVIAKTRRNLEVLDNRHVQDPALAELLYQVIAAQETSAKIKTSNGSPEDIRKQAEELRAQLARDRTDFLAARTYFWNNTIGIVQLQKALSDVQTALSANKAVGPN